MKDLAFSVMPFLLDPACSGSLDTAIPATSAVRVTSAAPTAATCTRCLLTRRAYLNGIADKSGQTIFVREPTA